MKNLKGNPCPTTPAAMTVAAGVRVGSSLLRLILLVTAILCLAASTFAFQFPVSVKSADKRSERPTTVNARTPFQFSWLIGRSVPNLAQTYKVNGSVYDRSDRLVPRIRLRVLNNGRAIIDEEKPGRFSVYIPRGSYTFEIRDLNGNLNSFKNLRVGSNTSINFMFGLHRPDLTLIASPATIEAGQSTTLSWNSRGATSIRFDGTLGDVPGSGSRDVRPTGTTIYRITAANKTGATTRSVKVTVNPPSSPEVTFEAMSDRIKRGDSTELYWGVVGANAIRINQGIGDVSTKGSLVVSPRRTRTYVISASNATGSVERSVTVRVDGTATGLPTASLRVSSTKIRSGQSTRLSWTTSGASFVTISPGIGVVGASGSINLSPNRTGTYTLSAVNDKGTTRKSIKIDVSPAPPPDPPDVDPEPDEESEPEEEEPQEAKSFTDPIAPVATPFGPKPEEPGPWDLSALSAGELLALATFAVMVLGLLGWLLWPLLGQFAYWAAGLFGLGMAGATADDEVHCTLYSAPEVSAGNDLLVQVFAHLEDQIEGLDELASDLDPETKKQISRKLKKRVARESVLTFRLMMPGILTEDEEEDLVWEGEPDSVEFIVPIPEDHAAGRRFGRVFVYNNGDQIGKISFRVNILPRELQLDASAVSPEVGGVMSSNETAFISYASRDKDKVYRFVQLLDAIQYDYHIDIFHIDAGERWEQKLYKFIDNDDVFLLFWSRAASESEWVLREAERAKHRMMTDKNRLPRIVIHRLDNDREVPEWLHDIHVDRKWAEILGNMESEGGQ